MTMRKCPKAICVSLLVLVHFSLAKECQTPGWFGDHCTYMCHCKDNDRCDVNGTCPDGVCLDGYFGQHCQFEDRALGGFSTKATVLTDGDNSTCLPKGTTSFSVQLGAPVNFTLMRIVTQESGKFANLDVAFFTKSDVRIEQQPSLTRTVNGRIMDIYGQLERKVGKIQLNWKNAEDSASYCSVLITEGCGHNRWGPGCSNTCSEACAGVHDPCDKANAGGGTPCTDAKPTTTSTTGLCDQYTGSCIKGCLPGYTGLSCNETCKEGTWGKRCTNKCGTHCAGNGSCEHTSGRCTHGCKPGFTLDTCVQFSPVSDHINVYPPLLALLLILGAVVTGVIVSASFERISFSDDESPGSSVHSFPLNVIHRSGHKLWNPRF